MKKIILIGLLFTANHLFAAAATVLFTKNKVVASRNGAERTLSRGASLDPGDEIITAAEAVIHFQYTNGTLVNIGSDSKYKILAYTPKQAANQTNAELSKGKLEIQNAGKIKETLKTPIVPLAILGTHIRVYASLANHALGNKKNPKCAGIHASEQTNVQVLEGIVSTRNKLLKAGDSVRISCDRIVDAPFPPEGVVVSPQGSPGKIEATAVGTAVGAAVGAAVGTAVSTTVEFGSGGQIGSEIGADSTTYVATNQEVGVSTTSGIQALLAITALSEISVVCN